MTPRMPEVEDENEERTIVIKANPARKVFRPLTKTLNKIPDDILNNFDLNESIKSLPSNYNFEVHKTVWRIKSLEAKRVALQMPEGLLPFSTRLCDIIERFTEADTVIMGDVTYGACCVDDYTATALNVDLLVHYGHSCLVPVDRMENIKVLYVFVDIKVDGAHFIDTIKHNFSKEDKLCFTSTVQFITTLHAAASALNKDGYDITIPQSKPLSRGEILGCTAPTVRDVDVLIYLGDGRFHLEAAMIANPNLRAFRYDPYEKKLTEEWYNHAALYEGRRLAINKSKESSVFGLILGTLGRQGNPNVMNNFKCQLAKSGKSFVIVLLSEIYPDKLKMFKNVDSWIQIACPRLSIDWGSQFPTPLLSPWEAAVALGQTEWDAANKSGLLMDFYSNESLGPWTPNFKKECCGKGCKN
ncbi:2-(3-amino-3-carboxypropyl)histidine synthase subunit 1 [Cimex lectularius]|uniref:2-(3-amino-3-carboxypropyl)histidine synthase subunit 1 n=1 Tax=Cimex lectularius TaxID=79782 RepID=A0A8I6RN11_CIMLE|nr:2-(3-amino-3-carboxypropyl)histidine synthase subunit 1 [Cimex lectularius]